MSLLRYLPGETPIDDLSGLKIKGLTTRAQLNPYEARNILKASERYFVGRLSRRKAPFDYAWSRRLHHEMFGDVWAWAGELRQSETTIGVEPPKIEPLLYELMQSLGEWSGLDWHLQAAMLHHRAVYIHPFPNGNGRWSRMLANIWLRLNGQPYTRWPEEAVGEASPVRGEYIAAIKEADNGDYEPLVSLHKQFTPAE
jgi:Fic-DOC domain mobile mystery protein B